jgi:hypothetical protein
MCFPLLKLGTPPQTKQINVVFITLFYFIFNFSPFHLDVIPHRQRGRKSLSLSRPRSKCYSTCFYCSIWSPVPGSLPWIMDGSVVGLRNPFISGSHAFISQFQTWSHSTCALVVLFNPKIFGELIDSIHGHELKGD